MNFRTTLFLLVLVAAVGITIYFKSGQGDNSKTPDKTDAQKLLKDVEIADISRLAVTSSNSSDNPRLILHKVDGRWMMEEPMAVRAKTFEVDDLVRALVDLQTRGELDESRKNSGGLDQPSFVVEITGKADKVYKLSFGDKSAVGDSLNVLVDGNPKPQIVGNAIYARLDKPASTYRDMQLVTTPSSAIQQVQISREGSTVKLAKTGENWKIVEPVDAAADSSAVSDLLSSLTNLNATEFLDAPPAVVTRSLKHPQLTVSFSTAAPTTQPAVPPATTQPTDLAGMDTLRFGGFRDVKKTSVFVSLNGKDVATIPAVSQKSFEKTSLDFRNKDVATIDPELVKSVTIKINRPATTQPTTRPAELREFTIERRKVAQPVLGPALPTTGPAVAATMPSTSPTTQSVASTQPARTLSTQPATAPALATTKPVDENADAKWLFTQGASGRAEEGQVDALLAAFHPLHAERYIEPSKDTGDTFTVTIQTVPGKAADSAKEYVFTFVEAPSRVIGTDGDLQFEVERSLLDKLNGDFKTKKVAPPPAPSFPGQIPGQ